MKALEIFAGSDGAVTREYYSRLELRGPLGSIAMHLFRAQKYSSRAKKYRGGVRGVGSYSSLAYSHKGWSLEELCRILGHHSAEFGIRYGWKLDSGKSPVHWVLYVDLPQGQVSFHSMTRYDGPDYPGEWDGFRGLSEPRILRFCDEVWNNVAFAGATTSGQAALFT